MCATHCSCQGNCRNNSVDKQTNTHAPGKALPWMTNTSHRGAVTAAPLYTVSSLPWSKVVHWRQIIPNPCKLTPFLWKYPSSKLRIRNSPPRRGNNIVLPFTFHPAAPGEMKQRHLWRFSTQTAKGSQSSGLLGVASPVNWVKWVCHLWIE